MRVIISGGGTGGHIYPAVTIARALIDASENCQILFVGTKQGLEADIIPKEGFEFKAVEGQGFERKLSFGTIKTIFKAFAGLGQSIGVIRSFKPDIVIGTGGYVCGPILLAAALMGIPAMIQEQNVIPGVTNKILARFVKKVAVGYAQTTEFFGKYSDKVVVTGNPVRKAVLLATREEGIRDLSLSGQKLTVLVAGGSRGARSINNAMIKVHRRFAGQDGIQILHVTGQNEYNNIVGLIEKSGIAAEKAGNIKVVPYLYDMPKALAVADIAVFRAGAVGLAELTVRGIPAILIPYPYAAENHQEFNARSLESAGAAVVIKDAELTGKRLVSELEKLIADRQRLGEMAIASKKQGRPDAAAMIAQIAIKLANSSSK